MFPPPSEHPQTIQNFCVLDKSKGNRPKINEPEAPKCYIDLMKKCWDSNPNNRPNAIEVEKSISLFHKWEEGDKEIRRQFEEAEEFRKANLSFNKNNQSTTHPKAYYTSRLLNPFTKNLYSVDVIDFTK